MATGQDPAMNSVGPESIAVAKGPAGLMEARVAMICLGSPGIAGVPSKNKSSCTITLLSYEPFSFFLDLEEENQIFSIIANGLYLKIKISVKLVFE